jgi:hypothetical protein
MAQQVNWAAIEAKAKKMSNEELIYAMSDCRECCRAMGNAEMFGKDSNYYRDESSVYHRILTARRTKGSK